MKKENYGIPAPLLCIAIYLLGLLCAVGGSLWPILGATVLVFALQFESNVKKVVLQALGLVLLVVVIDVVFDTINTLINMFLGFTTIEYGMPTVSSSSVDDNIFYTVENILLYLVDIATYVVFIILACASLNGKGIVINKVHMIVDGFVPVRQQPMYGQQPQQFANQNGFAPQGQPQQFGGRPQQMNGQPMNGQPMNGQPMNGQPMNGQPMNGQPMNGQPFNNGLNNPNNHLNK